MTLLIRLKTALNSRKGNGVFAAAFVLAALIMITSVMMEFSRMSTFTAQISDAVESSVISVCADNYSQTYTGLREGYSGGYVRNAQSWTDNVSPGAVYAYLDKRLSTAPGVGGHARYVDGALLYLISDLRVKIENVPLAPGETDTEQFAGTATFTLTIPLSGVWNALPPMVAEKTVTAGFSAKF